MKYKLEVPVSDVKPITTQYNQKSRNNLSSRGLGLDMGGSRLKSYRKRIRLMKNNDSQLKFLKCFAE